MQQKPPWHPSANQSRADSGAVKVGKGWFPTMMPHSVNHLFSDFCQDRSAAEGDWDLIDYSRSRDFSRPH